MAGRRPKMHALLLIALMLAPTPTQRIEHWLATERKVPRAHAVANQIVYAAGLTKLDPFVLTALIDLESDEGWSHKCRGAAGEIGVTQILPDTARRCKYDEDRLRRDRDYQILCGAYYLAGQRGGIAEKLQRYNGGPSGPKKQRCRTYARVVLAKAAKVK